MTGTFAYTVFGLMAPVAGGMGLARLLFPAVTGARAAEWLGIGLLTGPAVASLAMHLMAGDTAAGAWLGLGVLAALAVLGFTLPAGQPAAGPQAASGESSILRVAAGLAAALVLVQLALVVQEILWRPTYPWDAWSAWAYKAKAWYLAGGLPAFVEPGAWPAAGETGAYPVTAPHYPTLVAGFQVYLATWLGQWHEPLLNLPWLMVYSAVALLLYGEGFRLSGSRAAAVLLAGLVLSVPLLATHAALAGYMDLWVAGGLLAFILSLARSPGRSSRALMMTVILGAVLATLKVEAAIWLAVVLAALAPRLAGALGGRLPVLHRILSGPVLAAASLLGAGVAAMFEFSVSLPYLGDLAFGFNPEAAGVLATVFASWNWHLFFPVLGACLVADAWLRSRDPGLAFWRAVAVAGLGAVAVLCLLTRVAGESTDVTNYNRIILQWVPVWAVYGAAVIFRRDTRS